MELKKLELFGFKSFADRTRFEFDSGITVIVGPNGCGKSNVVDAVKWVLGEQSAKSLRGREMADVIFAGSESRRSLGFAEAALTFDNAGGVLPIDVAEVEVARRLYRSGESEYLLNRRPCRLRDIRELFMDTGVGLDAYSLIEQGKVDVLLQSNPGERRAIFEEAAGISKYKAKRREAERKLARTEQNLLRLGDILEEVERRLRSVKYQAGKARNYLQYTERLNELRLDYALNQYHEQATAIASHRAEIDRLQDRRAERAGALAAADQDRARLETELMDLEDRARTAEGRLGDLRSGIATRDSETAFQRTRITEAEQQVARARRTIGQMTERLRRAQEAIEARRRDLAAVAARTEDQAEAVARIEETLRRVGDQVRALTGRLEHAKAGLMELAQQKSQRASRLAGLRMRLENLHAQAEKLGRRRDEVRERLGELLRRQDEFRAERQTIREGLADRRHRLEARRKEAEAKHREMETLGERVAAARQRASGLESRRELLEDLERRGEGIPAAVRKADEAIRESGRADRWRGMVADLIEVDVAHAVFIESALGQAEKLLVADHRADVLALARQLEGQLPGQVRFLALDAIDPAGDDPPGGAAERPDLSAYPEAVGWAGDYVRVDETVRAAIEYLLGRTVVVRSLEGAVELARGALRGCRFVTLAGNVLEADGTVAVGPPGPETSLISRRSELRNVQVEHASVAARIEVLDADRARGLDAMRLLDAEQQELRQEIYEGSMAEVEVEGQLRRLIETREQLEAETPLLESELSELAAQSGEVRSEVDGLAAQVEDLERRAADQQAAIEGLVAEQETLLERRGRLEEERTDARVQLAQLREKHAALKDQFAAAERDRIAAEDGMRQGRTDLADSGDRIRDAERTMLRLQAELSGLFLEKETAEAEVRRLGAERSDRRTALSGLSERARALEAEVDGLQEQVHGLELEGRELETRREDLVQRIRDDFDVDLVRRYAGWQPEDVDWDAVAAEIRDLTGKVERLGAVNLEAIEEQEALEARVEFLRKQNEDLAAARDALGNLIERINHESRQRFLATFESVRGHFQELFRKLFGGGKADVFLEAPEDVLESGIEIVARPPGKQLQRISLLSGGEKTMTAVALLLAIFRARPSPFCILDEVDAALDEANIDRFTALIREFLDQSQFVVISHNKRTMSIADVLYGVTMQEPGVSRKVSVKFSELGEKGLLPTEGAEATSRTGPAAGPDVAATDQAGVHAGGAHEVVEDDEADDGETSFSDEPADVPAEEPVPAK